MDMIVAFLIGIILGGVIVALLYYFTRPYHEEKKEEFREWKRKILVIENWKETQEGHQKVNANNILRLNNGFDKFSKRFEDYEKSAMQLHEDYIMVNGQIAAIERRYADLVPVHRHYYLNDETLKIKRVTNERHGRTDAPASGARETVFGKTDERNQAFQFPAGHDARSGAPEARIPDYRPPSPGTFGPK